MRIYKQMVSSSIAIFLFLTTALMASAGEPRRPDVDHNFTAKKEAKIKKLQSQSIENAFKKLKDADFLVDQDFLNKAIYAAFKYRGKDAVSYAFAYFRRPVKETVDGRLIDRNDDFYVAKKILQVFPDDAVDPLLALYKHARPVTRGNVIRGAGNLAGGKRIKDMLVNALNDKAFCEESDLELEGDPMRVCDMAYNQLVLRYKIKNLPRVIGSIHRIQVRDHYINLLKRHF